MMQDDVLGGCVCPGVVVDVVIAVETVEIVVIVIGFVEKQFGGYGY